jgi:ribose-phosphate pyrophosphokinase
MPAKLPENVRDGVTFANGVTHPELGLRVASLLGLEPIKADLRDFSDTEVYARYLESVRGTTLIAFETHAAVNGRSIPHALHRHAHMIDAGVGGLAEKIIAVAPYLSGQRQDREAQPREAVSANLNLRYLKMAGASHVMTVDMHEGHSLLELRRPGYGYSNLTAHHLLRDKIGELMVGEKENYVVVSPDEGHSKQLRDDADALGIDLIDLVKERNPDHDDSVTHMGNLEAVEGKTAVIIDDQISTAGTIKSAAENSKKSGAEAVIVATTHGIFSGPALSRLASRSIDHIITTDTIPTRQAIERLGDKLQVASVDELIANALYQILIPRGSLSAIPGGDARI